MTEQHRTVAAERDMSRIHQWLDTAVAHAVNDAAKALNAIRYWCDQTASSIAECPVCRNDPEDFCDTCAALAVCVDQVRALLPAIGDTPIRRGSSAGGGDSSGNASDALRRRGRPGHVNPGGSETGGGYRTP